MATFTLVLDPNNLGYKPQIGYPFLATIGTFLYAFTVASVEYVTQDDEFRLCLTTEGPVHYFDMTTDCWYERLACYLTETRDTASTSAESGGEIIELPRL